jgi:hypothetical protein
VYEVKLAMGPAAVIWAASFCSSMQQLASGFHPRVVRLKHSRQTATGCWQDTQLSGCCSQQQVAPSLVHSSCGLPGGPGVAQTKRRCSEQGRSFHSVCHLESSSSHKITAQPSLPLLLSGCAGAHILNVEVEPSAHLLKAPPLSLVKPIQTWCHFSGEDLHVARACAAVVMVASSMFWLWQYVLASFHVFESL